MKITGLTRRVDSLGRIVIPKELRRMLHIKEGSPLEIYMDADETIVLKKYSQVGSLSVKTFTSTGTYGAKRSENTAGEFREAHFHKGMSWMECQKSCL